MRVNEYQRKVVSGEYCGPIGDLHQCAWREDLAGVLWWVAKLAAEQGVKLEKIAKEYEDE